MLTRIPYDQVPPENREVYLRDGELVSSSQDADTIVPIVRVVRLLVDDAGSPADDDQATRALIREFDAEGVMLRETVQLRPR
ncbi:hypothetical protein D3C72_2086260 [compost metagenome]